MDSSKFCHWLYYYGMYTEMNIYHELSYISYITDLYVIKIQKYVHMCVSTIYKICAKNIQICKKKIELKKKL
jgi:hypothetical protein